MRPRAKVALVTGGSRGIGRALCLGLAREGADVVVNYLVQEEEAHNVVEEIRVAGGRALAVQGDVSRVADVSAVVAATVRAFGSVDILVNNAARTEVHKPWPEISEAEWDDVMAVNLKSCFLFLRAVYPYMRTHGWGRIINISSVTFWLGRPNLLHYVASKGGMIGFTRSLARELGPDGITVNAITPGAIVTDAETASFPDREEIDAWLLDVQALKRRGVPEDIASAVVYLASTDASFITGQTINVDGGWAMH